MSAAKHTPGVWLVDVDDGDVTIYSGGVNIASIDGGEAEYMANAQLIAAAPELLAACKLFIEYEKSADSDDGIAMMLAYNAAHDAIRAAVAKAEGRAV